MRLVSLLLLLAGFTTTTLAETVPFACNMNAMSKEERQRYGALVLKMRKAQIGKKELANGLELSIDPRRFSLVELAEWITYESKCCPFLTFGVTVDKGNVRLALTGEKGVKDFLKAELGE